MSDLLARIAGAPITWGVDGSPGWGHIMSPDRVLGEMTSCGLRATELGPYGYLPSEPDELATLLDRYELRMVGGFVPAVLYRRDQIDDVLAYVRRAAAQLARAGAEVLVLGPAGDQEGYDNPIEMDGAEWQQFLDGVKRVDEITAGAGLVTALHPHWGMAIATGAHTERLLESSDTGLCLDTGHLFLAGADPTAIAAMAPERTRHVHLKDLSATAAERVRSGAVGFRQAVIEGMFTPLGAGDVDVTGVIQALEAAGYRGWYVLEQDSSLASEPRDGEGPKADAEASVRFLERLEATL